MRGPARLAWLCLGPALAWMLLWLGLPLAETLWLALRDPGAFLGLALDARVRGSAAFTILFSAFSVLLELLLGLLLALALARPLPLAWLWRLCLLIPWALPTAISAKAFAWLFNYQFGLANLALAGLGLEPLNWFASAGGAWAALLALELWKTVPLVTLLLLAGRLQLSAAPYEAAALDGAGEWACFRHVTLPQLLPMLGVAALLRSADALRIFDSVWVLSGGGPSGATESLSYLAYLHAFQFGDAASGARVALLSALLVAALALPLSRLLAPPKEGK